MDKSVVESIIGIAAGALTSASMIPQLVKVIRKREVKSLSPVMLTVLILGVGLWTGYGIMKGELPIILSNGFAVLVNSTLLFYYFRFRQNNNH